MLDKIKQSKFGEHNLILYEDYDALSNIRLEYCKTALETLNEMILLCDNMSINNLFLSLEITGLDVPKYRSEGSLVVVESKKGYIGLTNEFYIFSDKDLFFHDNRVNDLIKHEGGLFLSLSSSQYINKMKIFCCYNLFKSHDFYANLSFIDSVAAGHIAQCRILS
jgi:hypothetical protein